MCLHGRYRGLVHIGAAPVVAHITGSHVRVEPGRVAMIRDFLFFKDVLEIPRELVEGAEVVKTTVESGRETVRRTLVRIHLKERIHAIDGEGPGEARGGTRGCEITLRSGARSGRQRP